MSYLLQGGHGSWHLPTNLAEECYAAWNCRVGTVDSFDYNLSHLIKAGEG